MGQVFLHNVSLFVLFIRTPNHKSTSQVPRNAASTLPTTSVSDLRQSRNEGGAVRDGADTSLAHRTATMVAGQLGIQAGFINEYQLADIPAGLLPSPVPPQNPQSL
jgi:hypothetical protein